MSTVASPPASMMVAVMEGIARTSSGHSSCDLATRRTDSQCTAWLIGAGWRPGISVPEMIAPMTAAIAVTVNAVT